MGTCAFVGMVISTVGFSHKQGGGVVRLFHREKECYVSAEGSFADSQVVVEDGNEFCSVTSG